MLTSFDEKIVPVDPHAASPAIRGPITAHQREVIVGEFKGH